MVEVGPRASLEMSWKLYTATAFSVAEDQFTRFVKPFCEARGFKFLSGNGDWWIGPPEEDPWEPTDYMDDDEWQVIVSILSTEIDGMPANDLGSIMPDYTPEEETDV